MTVAGFGFVRTASFQEDPQLPRRAAWFGDHSRIFEYTAAFTANGGNRTTFVFTEPFDLNVGERVTGFRRGGLGNYQFPDSRITSKTSDTITVNTPFLDTGTGRIHPVDPILFPQIPDNFACQLFAQIDTNTKEAIFVTEGGQWGKLPGPSRSGLNHFTMLVKNTTRFNISANSMTKFNITLTG
jgi:hypothetical protein